MNKIIPLIFLLSISSLSFAQSTEERDQQLKDLIQQVESKNALPMIEKSAELGNPKAQYDFGFILYEGIGTQKNEQEAIEWFKKSSDNGFNNGHYALMMIYGNGQGVEQNLDKAFEYALKCANNDDPTCMWNVVACYVTGNGVEADISKFKTWMIRLAKLPNPEDLTQSGYITSARLELANFYSKGEYFEKDKYQSYLWYLIYNENKADFSSFEQDKIIQDIKAVAENLTKMQIKKAPQEAEQLLGRKLNNIGELYELSL